MMGTMMLTALSVAREREQGTFDRLLVTPFRPSEIMAAVGLGLFVSSISKTMQQAMLYAFVLVMPFALLSGFTTPFSSMPDVLQSVMVINPLRHALDITKRGYLEGAGFVTLVPDFLPLIVIGLVTLSGAAWLFRRRLA